VVEQTRDNARWHALEAEAVSHRLSVDPEFGLDESQVKQRRAEHGANLLAKAQRIRPALMILNQFRDFMILVLIAAAIVSGIIGHPRDAIAILVIVVLNATVGVVQEFRAERALEALRSLAAPTARVCRAGRMLTVSAKELVPGDVVSLEAGSAVPADLRLIEAQQLTVDESALTGESEPVAKQVDALPESDVPLGDRHNLLYKGSLISRGRAVGIVFATGENTELGRIAGLLRETAFSRTPLQQRLARFGRRLALLVIGICLTIFVAGILRGEPLVLMFLTAVSLAVAAIPEALPAVVTVALALGARKLGRVEALIRRLPAVETLGSVTYICADKTGTLTENRMRVDFVQIGDERHKRLSGSLAKRSPWLGPAMALNNDVLVDTEDGPGGDPTELALYEFAKNWGYDKQRIASDYPRLRETPFDSESRRMTTVHDGPEGPIAFVKGAPETVVPLCAKPPDSESGQALDETMERAGQLAHEGYRVLAFAGKRLQNRDDDIGAGLSLFGLAALSDPPRQGVPQAVEECRSAGITPVMITGDHPGTALAIARRVGIANNSDSVITGTDLAALTEAELAGRVGDARVYARVDPAQKIRIVEALQQRGEFVAMTGDGVNDAPALKRANIGVAMGKKGTDVAREAAAMVLLDDNFATIVAAVREGRRIFDNILKFIKYTMTSNSGEIWTMFLAPFLGLPIPLLPIHILWINLVTDGLPGLALTAEPAERGVMHRAPRPPQQSVFANGLGLHVLWVGLLIGGLSILSQAWAVDRGSDNWQTVVFTVLTFSQLVHVLVIRFDRESVFGRRFFKNWSLLAAILLTLLLQFAVIYLPPLQNIFNTAPLTAEELAVCSLLPLVVLVGVEIEKLVVRRGLIYRGAEGTNPVGRDISR
jgi:Ca2+-transporting ATPase